MLGTGRVAGEPVVDKIYPKPHKRNKLGPSMPYTLVEKDKETSVFIVCWFVVRQNLGKEVPENRTKVIGEVDTLAKV